MDAIERLTKLFTKFPGIGERQARRFAYFILAEELSYTEALAHAIKTARAHAHTCKRCFRIFEGDDSLCSICGDQTRNQQLLVVVEKSQDISAFTAIEYNGLFFNLGGLIPIVHKKVMAGTNITQLENRILEEMAIENGLQEIILAFPLTPNGEHTDSVVREAITKIAPMLRITSLGRGLSMGTELEYADPASLLASFKKRE